MLLLQVSVHISTICTFLKFDFVSQVAGNAHINNSRSICCNLFDHSIWCATYWLYVLSVQSKWSKSAPFKMSETTLYIMSLKVNIWGHHNVAVTMYPGKVSLQKCPAAAVCACVCVSFSVCTVDVLWACVAVSTTRAVVYLLHVKLTISMLAMNI